MGHLGTLLGSPFDISKFEKVSNYTVKPLGGESGLIMNPEAIDIENIKEIKYHEILPKFANYEFIKNTVDDNYAINTIKSIIQNGIDYSEISIINEDTQKKFGIFFNRYLNTLEIMDKSEERGQMRIGDFINEFEYSINKGYAIFLNNENIGNKIYQEILEASININDFEVAEKMRENMEFGKRIEAQIKYENVLEI